MENIAIIVSIVSMAAAFASAIIAIATWLCTIRRDRKQATLEVYNRLQSEVFDAINTYTPAEITDICGDRKSAEYKTLSGYLARIEHFCVGLNEKIYDLDVFYAMAHGYFDGYMLRNRIKPLIESKHCGKGGTEIFYTNIISVWDWMDKRKMN